MLECGVLWERDGCSAPFPFHQTIATGGAAGEKRKIF